MRRDKIRDWGFKGPDSHQIIVAHILWTLNLPIKASQIGSGLENNSMFSGCQP